MTADRSITGALDGADLVLTRELPAPRADVWSRLAESDGLATWFGTFTGDPASGTVQVTGTAEPGEAEPTEYTIHECTPEEALEVSSAFGEGAWRLRVELSDAPGADGGDSTRLVFRHVDVPAAMLGDVGAGWEWYLDRLTAAVTGAQLPGLEVFESDYMPFAAGYAALQG